MKRSEQCNELAAALAKAQVEMSNPAFDSQNPHFRSKFASLAAVRNAVIPVLAKHGISLTQELTLTDRGASCLTVLLHSSGQFMELGPLEMPASKSDAQGFGSASTYAKRYSMQAVAGVVGDEDDDGNQASGRDKHDPRGETSSFNAAEKDKYVGRFLDALNADLDEDAMAKLVHDIHSEIASKSDLYIAVADELGPKHKSAIKAFVRHHSETLKRGSQEMRDAHRMRAPS